MSNILRTIFFEPRLAFGIFVIFIVVYLIILDVDGAFDKEFLHFGPSDTEFLNMKLDTWSKVIAVYCIAFFSELLTNYYHAVQGDFIHQYIFNPAYTKTIKISKQWATMILVIEPFLFWILQTLNFFINLTMQLQFIIPKFIGYMIVEIPFVLYKINQKKYV